MHAVLLLGLPLLTILTAREPPVAGSPLNAPLRLPPPRPHCSAFPNARALAKEGAATQLVVALRGHEAQQRGTTTALATALKQVAATCCCGGQHKAHL